MALAKSRLFEVRYMVEARNIPSNAGEFRLWIPLPQSNLHQRIAGMKILSPFRCRMTTDEAYGNKIAFFSIPDPPSHVNVEIRFRVRRFENNARYGRGSDARIRGLALRPAKLIPLSPDIRRMAERIAAGKKTNTEKARAFYEHVIKQMEYDKTGTRWGRGDFRYACEVRKGNCTDYHAYFIGLCRNVGIPAYFEIGLAIPTQPRAGKTGAYHCWAYFWDGARWIPVDVSEADRHPDMKEYFFGSHCPHRVAFTSGRDIVLAPPQKGGPLNFFIYPYTEVDGKPHANVVKRSYYRDLEERTR